MTPDISTVKYAENVIKGYCDIHNFKVEVEHDTDYEGTVIYSRFRVNNDPSNIVSIKWPNVTIIQDTVDGVCNAIYSNVQKRRYDDMDISHEMKLLQNYHTNTRKPDPAPEISKVIFNPPATIVYWSDKTKTVVKCHEGDVFDPEKGLAMAIVKKMNGNTGKYCDIFKKWVPEEKGTGDLPKDPWGFDTMTCQFALQRLNEAAAKTTKSVKEMLNSLYGAPKKDAGWISVEDHTPETKGHYLVCNDAQCMYNVDYDPDSEGDVRFFRERVRYWMPTPELPVDKTEQKGE